MSKSVASSVSSAKKIHFRFHAGSLLALCLVLSNVVYGDNDLNRIRIQSLLDFNAILITEVDVVFVYDQATAEALPTTKGAWYAEKYDLLRDDPAQLDVVTTSIPQGFDSATLILPERAAQAVRVFAVAYHEAPGAALHDLTDRQSALIQIDPFGIRVSGQ